MYELILRRSAAARFMESQREDKLMKNLKIMSIPVFTGAALLLAGAGLSPAHAVEPCGDFGECKVLVEINASDGDIGFHFLVDGDDLFMVDLYDPDGKKIFSDKARGALRDQFMTETFVESAEPLCWYDPEAEEDEDVVTLADFVDRWEAGTYTFVGSGEEGEMLYGETGLSFTLPPAPADVDFELEEEEDGEFEGEISWGFGDDLGECTPEGSYPDGVTLATLAEVAVWEVVLEPDFDEEGPNAYYNQMKFVVRIPGAADEFEVEIPDDYLATLPANTPVKIEVGAITYDDNATFSEEDEFCVNEDDPDESDGLDGCGFEIED